MWGKQMNDYDWRGAIQTLKQQRNEAAHENRMLARRLDEMTSTLRDMEMDLQREHERRVTAERMLAHQARAAR